MFNKFLILGAFLALSWVGFAYANDNQIVASEVFYDEPAAGANTSNSIFQFTNAPQTTDVNTQNNALLQEVSSEEFGGNEIVYSDTGRVPTWPLAGTDADSVFICNGGDEDCDENRMGAMYNKKTVSTQNIFAIDGNNTLDTGWSGGANIIHTMPQPAGFMDECNSNAEMPLMGIEMMEDDGGSILAVSQERNRNCSRTRKIPIVGNLNNMGNVNPVVQGEVAMETSMDGWAIDESGVSSLNATFTEDVGLNSDVQIQSWIVESGKTMRSILTEWANREGWDLVWATSREYPIQANAVFKGRFVDVASALVRNFARATPVPYAKFYKGNKVIVISTVEE